MVIVNFSIVMGAGEVETGLFGALANGLHGRAAALFVVLAGVGLGLMAKRNISKSFYSTHFKRALFLLVIGLLNMLIFEADILHYYAFYFAIGVFYVRLRASLLVASIVVLMLAFVVMVIGLDYDVGWDWDNYAYNGFWTLRGFIRNLFFNGWHPVIPWLVFLLWGLLLSRLDLIARKVRMQVLISHGLLFVIASGLSYWLVGLVSPYDPEAAFLFATEPVPPMPLYILASGGAAGMVMALCLMAAPALHKIGVLAWLTRPGRQTLTLYVAHIYLGMGTLGALGMLVPSGHNQNINTVMWASLIFCVAAIFYAWAWSKITKYGPLEYLMRKLTG